MATVNRVPDLFLPPAAKPGRRRHRLVVPIAVALSVLGLAAIGFIGGVWYDALDADDAVDRYNQRHNIGVTPMVPTSSGLAPGMSLSGTF